MRTNPRPIRDGEPLLRPIRLGLEVGLKVDDLVDIRLKSGIIKDAIF